MDISTTCCTPIPRPTRSTLPTTATSQRSSKLGCVGAGIMDASEGTDERAGLFLKLAAQGCEIVEPPRIGITASRSRPAIPARGGAFTYPTTGAPTRHGRTALQIWWRCLPGWTSSDAVTAGPSSTLGRSRCTNNKVHGHMPPCRRPTGRGSARWVQDPSSNTTTRSRSPVGHTATRRSTCDVPCKYQGRLWSTPNCHIHGPVLHIGSRTSRCSNHRHC